MASSTTVRALLVLAVISSQSSAETELNATQGHPADIQMPPLHGPPLLVDIKSNIGRPGAVLYNLKSENTLRISYTLRCASYDTVYAVMATTSAENIASITSLPVYNISCADAQPMIVNETDIESSDPPIEGNTVDANPPFPPPAFVGVVTGDMNLTIRASQIGRSFLLVLANKLAGPDPPEKPMSFNIPGGPAYDAGFHDGDGTHNYSTSLEEMNDASGSPEGHDKTQPEGQGQGQGQGMPGLPPGLPPNTVGAAMIIVMQLPRPIDNIFRILVYIVIISATTGMGIKVDLRVVWLVLKKPVAPIIGLMCQYICMPLIAYGVAKLVPQESAAISLGIFACGIVPGGGMSNMFTYLLGGDLSLSVTMTTLSNILALGVLPAWIFTLGTTFQDDTVKLEVPFAKILETLAIVILPIFLGIFIQYKLPKLGKIITKVLKPALFIVVSFLIGFGIYTNMFIFELIRPMTIIAGCLLPYIGYLIGGGVALICCQTWTRVKTIAIETGIQNTGIAFLILFLSLPPPDNQLAAVAPASSAIMTPLPLFLAVILYAIYNRCFKKKPADNEQEEEKDPEKGKLSKKDKKARKAKRKEERKKALLQQLAKGEGTAAIILLWQKITNSKPQENVAEKMLNKELEVAPPEKQNLMKSAKV